MQACVCDPIFYYHRAGGSKNFLVRQTSGVDLGEAHK